MVGIDEFLIEILKECEKSELVRSVEVESFDNLILKVRVYLLKNLFINVFYNDHTKRIAFALIKNERRVFGADNTGGWHMHPVENPEEHRPSSPVSFGEFLKLVEESFRW